MTGPILAVFKAPDDPEEKEEWARHMVRIQIAMWVDDEGKCAYCLKPYSSVDDFLTRNPKGGYKGDQFVDTACWEAYEKIIGEKAP